MANTSSRMLRLLSLLQTQRFWGGNDLAERLGVSLRTVRRDVDRLRELGYPVQAQRGVEGGYQLTAGASLPPLVLDDDEAVALAVGLLNASQSSIAGMADAAVQALAKVVSVMPKRLRRRVDAVQAMTEPIAAYGRGPAIDPDLLTTLAQACRDGERVEFGYVAADSAQSSRRAEPHRLVSVGRRWYLVAYDLDRHDWRSFRLDRMNAGRTTGSRFAARTLPATDAAELVRAGLNQASSSYEVKAIVAAPSETVGERIGRWSQVEAVDERSSRVTIHCDGFEWAAIALAATQADFRIEAPAEFADYVADWGARFQRATIDHTWAADTTSLIGVD
jgi:predicted DNA-binding transcriptional regulator YafY